MVHGLKTALGFPGFFPRKMMGTPYFNGKIIGKSLEIGKIIGKS